MKNDIAKKGFGKPTKPYPEFPLYAHATGRWAKKTHGKLYYFGPWDDPSAALDRYLEQRDDLFAGRIPRSTPEDGVAVRDLLNHFLMAKQRQLEAGEITPRTFADYRATCSRVVNAFGKNRRMDDLRSDDFGKLRLWEVTMRHRQATWSRFFRL